MTVLKWPFHVVTNMTQSISKTWQVMAIFLTCFNKTSLMVRSLSIFIALLFLSFLFLSLVRNQCAVQPSICWSEVVLSWPQPAGAAMETVIITVGRPLRSSRLWWPSSLSFSRFFCLSLFIWAGRKGSWSQSPFEHERNYGLLKTAPWLPQIYSRPPGVDGSSLSIPFCSSFHPFFSLEGRVNQKRINLFC